MTKNYDLIIYSGMNCFTCYVKSLMFKILTYFLLNLLNLNSFLLTIIVRYQTHLKKINFNIVFSVIKQDHDPTM